MTEGEAYIEKKILVIEPEISKEMHFGFHPTASALVDHTTTLDEQSDPQLYGDGGLVMRALALVEPPIANDYKSGKQNRNARREAERKNKKLKKKYK